MPKNRYIYNNQTLRYEKVEITWKQRALQILGFVCAALVFGFAIVVMAFKFIDSPKERVLQAELDQVTYEFEQMNNTLDLYNEVLDDLQERDDNTYRVIFESDPMPRNSGVGGSDSKYEKLKDLPNSELVTTVQKRLDSLSRRLYTQSRSYDEITTMIKNREDLYASIPAIQPVANKDLKRLASGYGMRIDPIYKTRKMHWGLDFTAPTGTPVYATGKGKIARVQKLKTGYGYNVVVDHGYNYYSLYAHLSKITVKKGQAVARGEIIGEVGSTGKSTGPHLHYEVHKEEINRRGKKVLKKVNPAFYFYNDLSPEQFAELLEIANQNNQSFD